MTEANIRIRAGRPSGCRECHRQDNRRCQKRTRCKPRPSQETIEAKMNPMVVKGEGCWGWTGRLCRGRPRMWVHNRAYSAQRLMYEFRRSPIPDGLVIHESCGSRGCLNPDHLAVRPHQEVMVEWAAHARACKRTRAHGG